MNRRQFLAASFQIAATPSLFAMAAPKTGQHKIRQIDLWPLVYPMKGFFKFFHGGANNGGRASVLVRITTEDGVTGWGQSVPIPRWSDETLETCVIAIRDYYTPALIGLDPADLPGIQHAMDQAIAPAFSTGMPIARAGIEIAIWDLLGKIAGKPLHELWGKPAPDPLLLSWTLNTPTLDEIPDRIAEGKAAGYHHFNIKVGPDPDFDVKLATKVRELVPETFLWADANGGYEPANALAAAPRLKAAGVDILEAPMRPNEISAYQKITEMNVIPILMDEGVISMTDLREFTRLGMMHGMAAKPARCGGLSTCHEMISFLEERNMMWLGSGLTDPDFSLAGMLAVYAAHNLKKPAALNGPQFLDATILTKPIEIKDGYIYPPVGPGLGVEVDMDKVKALQVKI